MFGKFKLLILLHDGDTKSYLARHPAFDPTVYLHLLPKQDSAQRRRIMDCLDRVSPEGRALILERGELDGTTYVVTQKPPDFRSLLEWLERVTPPEHRASTPAPVIPDSPVISNPPPAQKAREPGEFTQMFSPVPPASSAPDVTPAQGMQSKRQPPGEFTQAFRVPTGPDSAPPPRSDPAPPSRSESADSDFDKAFRTPSLPPARESHDPLTATRKPDQGARPAFQGPGEFTQVFGQANLPPAAPNPLPLAPQAPPAPSAPPNVAAPEPAADEFRDLFGPQSDPPAAPAPAPVPPPAAAKPAQAPPKPAASSNRPIIIISIVLALAFILLIVFFVMRRPAG